MLYIEAADAGTAHPSLKTEYLTLFGKYVGTLKGDGYYFVNPFCTAVNPAADTHLNQSGDVDNGAAKSALSLAFSSGRAEVNVPGKKKLSLKIMTLNNNRQKINDCLGNPVEIGIAVMWRVVDTAKAVFNVDNYKDIFLFSAILLCAILSGFILMMWLRMWILLATGLPMREASEDPAKLWRPGSGTRSRSVWKKRDLRLWRHESHILL